MSAAGPYHDDRRPSFLEEMLHGRYRGDLVRSFPTQESRDRGIGDDAVEQLTRLIRAHVDPERVDREGVLPEGTLDRLRAGGWLGLSTPAALGGRELSPMNVFRVIHAAASHCVAVALVMAIQESIGAGAMLSTVEPGPLHDDLRTRVLRGDVSGAADTEPSGASNLGRETVAVPVPGEQAYLITGDKVYIGNGPVADVLTVSATVETDRGAERRLFLVDTRSPGFTVTAEHRFLGVHGFPNGALALREVRVPAHHMLVERGMSDDERLTPRLRTLVVRGRMHLIAAPSLALARLCTTWMEQFAARRRVDGRPLGDYDQVRDDLRRCRADVFAVETVVRWALLGGGGELNLLPEQVVAKNVASVTAWRVVDTALSLLAAEGFETAPSKADRGAPPVPLERAFRDARNFRISGGVDLLLDYWTALTHVFTGPEPAATGGDAPVPAGLGESLREHHGALMADVGQFARTRERLRSRYPDPAVLGARQRLLGSVARIGNEMFTVAAVLARAASEDSPQVEALARTVCEHARVRIDRLWRDVERIECEPDTAPGPDLHGVDWRLDADLATGGPPPEVSSP